MGSPPDYAREDSEHNEDCGNHDELCLTSNPFANGRVYSVVEDPQPEFNYVSPLLVPSYGDGGCNGDDLDEDSSASLDDSWTICDPPVDTPHPDMPDDSPVDNPAGRVPSIDRSSEDTPPNYCTAPAHLRRALAVTTEGISIIPRAHTFHRMVGIQITVNVDVTSDARSIFWAFDEEQYRVPEIAATVHPAVRSSLFMECS